MGALTADIRHSHDCSCVTGALHATQKPGSIMRVPVLGRGVTGSVRVQKRPTAPSAAPIVPLCSPSALLSELVMVPQRCHSVFAMVSQMSGLLGKLLETRA